LTLGCCELGEFLVRFKAGAESGDCPTHSLCAPGGVSLDLALPELEHLPSGGLKLSAFPLVSLGIKLEFAPPELNVGLW
jgi:hypothetical protein